MVNIEKAKIIAVKIILNLRFSIFLVTKRLIIKANRVAMLPIGTSSTQVGDIKLAIATPNVTAMTYLRLNNAK